MAVVTILGLISMIFASLVHFGNVKNGLKISFSLIFIFLALRYNFGNDYKVYYTSFFEINQYKSIDYFDESFHFEIGWLFLNRLFQPLGFFVMTAVLALFNCVIYYRFINKYVPAKYYWLAIFLYIFTPGFMLVHLTAMRQSVAIALFIFSIDYIYKKNAIVYFLCIGLASLFHTSALILIPVYFLIYVNAEVKNKRVVILFSIFISLFLFLKYLEPYINQFIISYFDKYEDYQVPGVLGTGFGVLFIASLFLFILYYEKFQNRETAVVFKIAFISFMFIPLSLVIQLIGRVGMYLEPAMLITYPIIFKDIRNPRYKLFFIATLVLMTIYAYFQFFKSETYRDYFATYHTIFSW